MQPTLLLSRPPQLRGAHRGAPRPRLAAADHPHLLPQSALHTHAAARRRLRLGRPVLAGSRAAAGHRTRHGAGARGAHHCWRSAWSRKGLRLRLIADLLLSREHILQDGDFASGLISQLHTVSQGWICTLFSPYLVRLVARHKRTSSGEIGTPGQQRCCCSQCFLFLSPGLAPFQIALLTRVLALRARFVLAAILALNGLFAGALLIALLLAPATLLRYAALERRFKPLARNLPLQRSVSLDAALWADAAATNTLRPERRGGAPMPAELSELLQEAEELYSRADQPPLTECDDTSTTALDSLTSLGPCGPSPEPLISENEREHF
eukprot:2039979-Pleurochrysis_carterae.AAC.1